MVPPLEKENNTYIRECTNTSNLKNNSLNASALAKQSLEYQHKGNEKVDELAKNTEILEVNIKTINFQDASVQIRTKHRLEWKPRN